MGDLAKEEFDHFPDCVWCAGAFRSILSSNLTWFQIISGDGWRLLTRPIIEKHPWTAIIILSVIFIMVFGLLNLITAVVLETLHDAREADLMTFAQQKDRQREEAWN